MLLCCEGFSDGLSRFASKISLNPMLPTFLASCKPQGTDETLTIPRQRRWENNEFLKSGSEVADEQLDQTVNWALVY